MKRLIKTKLVLTRLLEKLLILFFFCIVLLVITLVILRYGLNTTIVGGNELVVILFIYTSAIGAAVIVGKDEHIAITYFIEKLSPFMKKVAAIIKYLLVALLNGAMIKYSIPWISKTGAYFTAVLGIPRIYLQIVVPVSCSLVIIFCLLNVILHLYPAKKAVHQ